MKTLRKKLKAISFIMGSLILFASCSQYNNVESSSNKSLTGKQLFNEIYFGSSNNLNLDYVEKMQYYYSLNKIDSSKIKPDLDKIVNKIEELNPSFFENFKTNLNSKDLYLIDDELKKGSKVMKSAILKIPEMRDALLLGEKLAKEVNIEQFINGDGDINFKSLNNYLSENYGEEVAACGPTFCVAAVYLVVVQSAAAALNVAAFVFCYYWVKNNCKEKLQNAGIENITTLEREKIVNQIYNAL